MFIRAAFAGQVLARDRHFAGAKVLPQGALIHSDWRVFFSALGSFVACLVAVMLLTLALGAAGSTVPG